MSCDLCSGYRLNAPCPVCTPELPELDDDVLERFIDAFDDGEFDHVDEADDWLISEIRDDEERERYSQILHASEEYQSLDDSIGG